MLFTIKSIWLWFSCFVPKHQWKLSGVPFVLSSAVLRGVTNWFINVLNATSVGRWDCTSAKWSEGESQVVACLLLPKRLLSAACAVKPQMVCCLLMLSGLVKNHFDRIHSQVNLCTLILLLLYEIQRKPPLSSERERKQCCFPFPSRPQVHQIQWIIYHWLLFLCKVNMAAIKCRALIAMGMQSNLGLQLMILILNNQLTLSFWPTFQSM